MDKRRELMARRISERMDRLGIDPERWGWRKWAVLECMAGSVRGRVIQLHRAKKLRDFVSRETC